MKAIKRIADTLTLSRALLGLLFICLGMLYGAQALPLVCWLMIYSWTSDIIDGGLARKSGIAGSNWVGAHDLEFDMTVSAGLLIYMVSSDFIPLALAIGYLLFWALIFWRIGILSGPGKLFQAPIYGWLILVGLREAPSAALWIVGWIIAAIILTWPRFLQEVIPSFLVGMKEAWQNSRVPKDKS